MGGFSTVTPSSTNIAQTVWSYGPRTLTDIQSLVNAIQNNDPNLLSTLGDLPFLPAPMYAGQVSLTQVASFLSNLVQNYNAAGVIASFINSNPYSLWHMDYVTNLVQSPALGFTNASKILSAASSSVLASIAMSTNVPVTTLLALISNVALTATAAQGLLHGLANNYYYNKWLQAVTYNAPTSVTFSTNAVISTNVLIAQNITIASGVTVTCGTTTCFFIAQSFNNQGTIVNPYGAAGGPAVYGDWGGGFGGTGGGGVVVIAYTAAMGTINVNGANGMAATTSPGCCCGSCLGQVGFGGAGGAFALLGGMSVPLGGNGTVGPYLPLGGPNGGAGGGTSTNCGGGGGGGSATVNSFSNGNDLITYAIEGVSDWWLQNIIGKKPSSVTPLLYVYGSGGGGGASNATGYYGGGGGGGGGGEVIVYGYNVIAGTVFANGGNGGDGSPGLSQGGGGGGGGGGLLLVFYGPGGLNGTIGFEAVGGSGGLYSTNSYASAGQSGTYYAGSVTVNG
jgi:hypothetical protein